MSKEIEKELKQITDEIFSEMFSTEKFAGTAYCIEFEGESNAEFFKGHYRGLRKAKEIVEKHMFTLMIEREKSESQEREQ